METFSKLVSIDTKRISLIAELVAGFSFKDSFLKRPFIAQLKQPQQQSHMLFFAVGICHQTYALADENRNLYGWDYLEDGFLRMAHSNSFLLEPEQIAKKNTTQIKEELQKYFSPDGQAATCTLDRLDERAELYADMARGLLDKFNGNFLEVIRIANNCVIHDDEGFYALLSSFKAYTDPLFKKSSFLLKLLGDAGLIELIDPENLVPVMDYHMQRVLLRTACVKIHSSQLEYALKHRLETEHEQEIRANCIEAMKLIAKESGKDILRMNDVFYMLGRSCCLEKPLCIHGECDKTPCSITRSLQLTAHKTCVLAHACEATFDPSYLKFWQPIAFTHYY